jgi:hypothetical protein
MKTPVTETEAKNSVHSADAIKPEPVLFDAKALIDWLFPGQTGMSLLRLLVSGDYAGSQLECWMRA